MRAPFTALALLLITAAPALADGLEVDRHRWDRGRFELGPRLTHMSLTDVDTGQDLSMGGAGMLLRWRLSRRFGLEWGVDAVGATQEGPQEAYGDIERVSTASGLSLMYYLFPEDRLQVYGLIGFGVVSSEVHFEGIDESINFDMPMGQLGIGVQYRGASARYDLSLRSLAMHRDETDVEIESGYRGSYDGGEAPRYRLYKGSRTLDGGMLTLGICWGLGR